MPDNSRLTQLQRPSGAFAMLAIDQREALRNMLADHRQRTITDQEVQAFKLQAARTLTPFASAVLIDKQFALDEAIDQGAVSPGCALIAAADHFESAHGELVGRTHIDPAVNPAKYAALGVKALKLLVIYRPDEEPDHRVSMVQSFVRGCREAGLISIIEPIARKPLAGTGFDRDAGIVQAAAELGNLGADLYKAEVPYHGQARETEIRSACARLTGLIASPWVVLSSGVPEPLFPSAVQWACEEGASGFLAGRAVWASCLTRPDVPHSLATDAVDRLKRLCEVVDEAVHV
ncbi:aldolase [Arthrobacter sp. FW306-04-A]|uniref:aldolase n=1 Tax=Arthrobacter sp. FW306-04-A TaxID=2879619 RepID=UPI0037BF10C9|nr:aldolase [Arthrobacter sp. FW306-04-A]